MKTTNLVKIKINILKMTKIKNNNLENKRKLFM